MQGVRKRLAVARVNDAELEDWNREARRSGLSLSAWIRSMCNLTESVAKPPPVVYGPGVDSGLISRE